MTVKENIRDSDEPLHFQGLDSEEIPVEDRVAPSGAAEEEGPPAVGGGVPSKGGEGF